MSIPGLHGAVQTVTIWTNLAADLRRKLPAKSVSFEVDVQVIHNEQDDELAPLVKVSKGIEVKLESLNGTVAAALNDICEKHARGKQYGVVWQAEGGIDKVTTRMPVPLIRVRLV